MTLGVHGKFRMVENIFIIDFRLLFTILFITQVLSIIFLLVS